MMNQFEPPVSSISDWSVRYVIHFTDGSKMDCLTLDGAMRVIAHYYRVRRGELITDTTGEKISVWLYPGEIPIADVFVRA
jgi:hypothetical protein